MTATVAGDVSYDLAEGPVWDGEHDRLVWVDVRAGHVLTGTLSSLATSGTRVGVTHQLSFDGTVGAAVPADDGSILVAAADRLVVVAPDGARQDGPRVFPAGELRRLNDGACDPQGRFVVGTCTPHDEPSERELLVRIESDGSTTVLDDDLTLSNGLAWSADGSRLFSIDTMRRRVYVRPYGPDHVGERAVHLVVDGGYPDGMAIDADDHLWIALWGGHGVRRYDPRGRLVARVDVPAPHTSSVAFAGDDLRTMVITTATKDLTPRERDRFPASGMLFTARVDVPGLPPTRWRNTCT